MSAEKFFAMSATFSISKADQDWFPRWIFRYATHQDRSRNSDLEVTSDSVVSFLQEMRDHGVPAWKRLQATRAIQCYRSKVLKRRNPTLDEICAKLSQIAAMEAGDSDLQTDDQHRKTVAENVDRTLSEQLQTMQAELRLRHYAFETEKAYLGWI